jgi:hypothetical protein
VREHYKVLIIGNGFDLEHGFKTNYIDFLEATNQFIVYKHNSKQVSGFFLAEVLKKCDMETEFLMLAEKNAWLAYFLECNKNKSLSGDKWIDCEREIWNLISQFEKTYIDSKGDRIYDNQKAIIGNKLNVTPLLLRYHCYCGGTDVNYAVQCNEYRMNPKNIEFIEYLFCQLREFTRIFEIYCLCMVNQTAEEFAETYDLRNGTYRIDEQKTQQNKQSDTEIEETYKPKECEARHDVLLPLKAFDVDGVLSFNYTNTYEALYGNSQIKPSCYYIHGKAQKDFRQMNLVLGIDDPLEGDVASSQFVFSKFKKYFQRIIYKTGSEYKDLIADMKHSYIGIPHQIYIIGHSLGATDHDVLREFFNMYDKKHSDKKAMARITVFYHNEQSRIDAIQRVIEMVGKESLIERVHGADWSIRFVNQYDEVQGIFSNEETEFQKMLKLKL